MPTLHIDNANVSLGARRSEHHPADGAGRGGGEGEGRGGAQGQGGGGRRGGEGCYFCLCDP